MDTALIITQLLNGLQLGILLFLLASGLTLTFGIMDVINLAHGSFYMLGAFFCAAFTIETNSFLLGVLIAIPATAAVGLIAEKLIIHHLYTRTHLDQVLATFGLILICDTVVQLVWGPAGMSIPLPQWMNGQIALPTIWTPDLALPIYRLIIVAVGLVIALALYVFVHHTRLGMLIRAGASNRTMASALGTNIPFLFAIVFTLGASLAGIAGMLIAPITQASIGMGNEIIITAFVVVIIGGLGSMKGAFFASLLIGLIDTLGRAYLDDALKLVMPTNAAETAAPALSAMLVYILMAVVLVIRPQGLFPPRGHLQGQGR